MFESYLTHGSESLDGGGGGGTSKQDLEISWKMQNSSFWVCFVCTIHTIPRSQSSTEYKKVD